MKIRVIDGVRMAFWEEDGQRLCCRITEAEAETTVPVPTVPRKRSPQPLAFWPGVTFKRHDEL